MSTTTLKATRIRQLLVEGKTYSEITEATGASPSTISYHASRMQGKRPARRGKKYDWNYVQSYYDIGNGVSEVMDHFNMSSSVLHGARKRGAVVFYREMNIVEEEQPPHGLTVVNKNTGDVLYTITPSEKVMPNDGVRMVVFEGMPEHDHSNWLTIFRNADLDKGFKLAKMYVRRLNQGS